MDQLQDTAELDLLQIIEPGTPDDKPKVEYHPKSPWNDTTVAQLKRLIAEQLTCGQIGREMGITRNAIIGKIRRLGIGDTLKFHLSPGRPKSARKSRAKRKDSLDFRNFRTRTSLGSFTTYIEKIPETIPGLPPDRSPDAVSLFDVQSHQCRWPCSQAGEPFMFCGSDKFAEHSYCDRHFQLSRAVPHARGHERPDTAARLRRRMSSTIGLLHADGVAE